MNFLRMLNELKEERDRITEAIMVLERLAAAGPKRKGRPPSWMAALRDSAGGVRGLPARVPRTRGTVPVPEISSKAKGKTRRVANKRKLFTLATRRKMAVSQRRRWARVRETA